MRKSLGSKPKGVIKVKVSFASLGGILGSTGGALTRPISHLLVRGGGERAYTLGPERW